VCLTGSLQSEMAHACRVALDSKLRVVQVTFQQLAKICDRGQVGVQWRVLTLPMAAAAVVQRQACHTHCTLRLLVGNCVVLQGTALQFLSDLLSAGGERLVGMLGAMLEGAPCDCAVLAGWQRRR
jgi:hypothetical protein